jgi:WXG100 family type VII secretion target
MSNMGIRVTPEQLQAVSGRLTAGAGEIEGILGQLAGNVAPLGSDWAGVAQARFLELWAQWQTSAKSLQEALTGIAGLTGQAAASYADTEQSIAAAFGRAG